MLFRAQTHLHDQADAILGLLAVQQSHHILMVQLGELLQDLDLLAEQILRLQLSLLRDALDGHRHVFL